MEAIKIAIATVTNRSLAERQGQQPLVELFTVGFSWLGRGAVGPEGVLPARKSALSTSLMACPMFSTSVIPTWLSYFSSLVSRTKNAFSKSLFPPPRDDFVNLANPMWLHILGSKCDLEGAKSDQFRNVHGVKRASV